MTCYSNNRTTIECVNWAAGICGIFVFVGCITSGIVFSRNYSEYNDLQPLQNCSITNKYAYLNGKKIEYTYYIIAEYAGISLIGSVDKTTQVYDIGTIMCYYDPSATYATDSKLILTKTFPQASFITLLVFASLVAVNLIYVMISCILNCCNRSQTRTEPIPCERYESRRKVSKKKDIENKDKIENSNNSSNNSYQNNSSESSSNKIQATEDCVVCQEQKPNTLLVPCHHICVCVTCSEEIKKCPICRKNISATKIVFPV